LIPIKKLGIEPIFYDIELDDLNPSLDSIKMFTTKYQVEAILVASMYGNPANMIAIERYCKDNNIFLIDDSAQSFGAKLDNRYIGTFGNAGFFSFSTGKPTAGHMGSFFWSEKDIQIKRTKHCFVHYFRWLDFYYNRYKIYDNTSKIVKKVVNLFSRLQLKLIDIIDDDICEFEKEILGGILTNSFAFREKYYNEFLSLFKKNDYFRVVESKRGTPNRHKFILIFQNRDIANFFLEYMDRYSIYASNGYKLLSDNLKELPNAKEIDGKVVELPIEESQERMEYLFKKVKEFEYKNS
jgi:dTDP-4-amino-4,6-dideoxygalactose transaminase